MPIILPSSTSKDGSSSDFNATFKPLFLSNVSASSTLKFLTSGIFTSFEVANIDNAKYTIPKITTKLPRTLPKIIIVLFLLSFVSLIWLTRLSSIFSLSTSKATSSDIPSLYLSFIFGSSNLSLFKHVSKSSCISLALLYLFLGFFAVALIIIFSTLCGIFGNSLLIEGIGSFKCFNAISTALSPLKGRYPVKSSYIIIPRE